MTAASDLAVLSRRIRSERRKRGWCQVELAAECGVLRTLLSKWERGVYLPSLPHLCRLADAFDTSLDALVGREPS